MKCDICKKTHKGMTTCLECGSLFCANCGDEKMERCGICRQFEQDKENQDSSSDD
ncbi:MAG: hypothetical protein PHG04_01565 [Candidatus Nanoarchaeia archaeon]|nr:hypothetical protein [Candidatus Nanoarchaeia archaeon]